MLSHIDHLVLTVRSLDAACDWYTRVLGMTRVDNPGKPTALHFGRSKLNLHQADHTFEPKALHPTPGAADFCLITSQPLDDLRAHLAALAILIERGPIERSGAHGAMDSIYLRDPDRNLVEISHYR